MSPLPHNDLHTRSRPASLPTAHIIVPRREVAIRSGGIENDISGDGVRFSLLARRWIRNLAIAIVVEHDLVSQFSPRVPQALFRCVARAAFAWRRFPKA